MSPVTVALPGVTKTTGAGGNEPDVAKRQLTLDNGATIDESLYKYEAETMSYSYRIDNVDVKVLPVNNYSSTIIVLPADGGKSTVEWRGATRQFSPRRLTFRSLAPRSQPFGNAFVADYLGAIEFAKPFVDFSKLPFLRIHVGGNCLRRQKRFRAVGAGGQSVEPILYVRVQADR